jgi:hypothetical protein
LLVLVVTLILVAIFRGSATWFEIFLYPVLVFFFFQQFLGGFGFITGYVPIAQMIINWLSRTSKKKAYCEEDIKEWEKKLDKLMQNEEKDRKKLMNVINSTNADYIKVKQLIEGGEKTTWRAKRSYRVLERKLNKLRKDEEKLRDGYEKEKDRCRKEMKKYRGKISERIITKQEELEPTKFKFIMLAPLYFMLILGIVLTLIGIINPIIRWAQGNPIRILDTIDVIFEYYKGIMAAVSITVLYIVPSIRIYKDPTKEYIPLMKDERKRVLFIFRKREKDPRNLLNRQFEDLRKYYWDIKQIIRKALLIPIGLSLLVAAPIGGLSIVLGVKSSIQRKELKKYELIIQILIAIALIGLVVTTYFTMFGNYLKIGIHPMIAILLKLIYGSALILSFVLFTKQPIAEIERLR